MESRLSPRQRTRRAFTLIELLVVIAIIAILAAILFPTFGAVREQARQSSTMSNMHAVYVGAKLFNEDEGRYPSVLFGYAEAPDNTQTPPQRPAVAADVPTNITPMDQAKEFFSTYTGTVQQGLNRGYLYPEQVKDYISFTTPDNIIKDRRATTQVYYPHNSLYNPDKVVVWEAPGTGACPTTGDRDIPNASYVGKPKLYYVMDSMDIGPRLDQNGNIKYTAGVLDYELHYSPDWTRKLGTACEPADSANGNQIDVTQLKYKNPPADRTVLTYVTQHVATAGSSKVMVILLSGTAKKMDVKAAANQLPLNFKP
jgi:prepilin-type N-terminal cleavage/methylation domain-containing protein